MQIVKLAEKMISNLIFIFVIYIIQCIFFCFETNKIQYKRGRNLYQAHSKHMLHRQMSLGKIQDISSSHVGSL